MSRDETLYLADIQESMDTLGLTTKLCAILSKMRYPPYWQQ